MRPQVSVLLLFSKKFEKRPVGDNYFPSQTDIGSAYLPDTSIPLGSIKKDDR